MKHLLVGGSAATAAYAGAQLFNPVGAAALAATSATATDYVLSKGMSSRSSEIAAQCPDQIISGWGLLGQLIETAGLWVGLFFLVTALVPLILGYLLPGPLERRSKSRRRR